MHAVWSVGALVGTGIGTAAASAGVGVVAQTVGARRSSALALVAAARRATHDVPVARAAAAAAATPDAGPPGRRARPRPTVPPAARVCGCLIATTGLVVATVESVANEWSALTLREGLGTSLAVAGLGPTAYAAAMLVGRLVGDRAIDRVGAGRRRGRVPPPSWSAVAAGSLWPPGSRSRRCCSAVWSSPGWGRRRCSR